MLGPRSASERGLSAIVVEIVYSAFIPPVFCRRQV